MNDRRDKVRNNTFVICITSFLKNRDVNTIKTEVATKKHDIRKTVLLKLSFLLIQNEIKQKI